jgi:hypothetical protein
MIVWNRPSLTELRMDAEIGAYQDDFDQPRREHCYACHPVRVVALNRRAQRSSVIHPTKPREHQGVSTCRG